MTAAADAGGPGAFTAYVECTYLAGGTFAGWASNEGQAAAGVWQMLDSHLVLHVLQGQPSNQAWAKHVNATCTAPAFGESFAVFVS